MAGGRPHPYPVSMRVIVLWCLVVLGIAAAGALLVGRTTWSARSETLRAELTTQERGTGPTVFDTTELTALPAPVARMLRSVLTPGQPLIRELRLEHRGDFDMGRDSTRWATFHSRQLVVTQRPGFLWDARIRMGPGLPVFVHDAYVAGRGVLTAKLFGLVTVMEAEQSKELAEGEFLRWVAEAAWYPTALLPSQGAAWRYLDDRSALLTMRDGITAATVTVGFDDAGRIARVRAERRARETPDGPVPTPWEGRFWDYIRQDGMWIPRQGEVAWLLPDGPRPYWRGHIERVTYTFLR